MSMVRFAMLCDHCGTRSEEYTPWATCRECGEDFCPNCSTEHTEDERNRCICASCKALQAPLTPMPCEEALKICLHPLSFIDQFGVRCTALWIAHQPIATAANCVEYDEKYRRFVISTAACL